MTNYEAFQHLSPTELANILDQIFCTGLNRAAVQAPPDDPMGMEATECPFTEEWLNAPAEEAAIHPLLSDGDMLMLDAFSASVFDLCFGGPPSGFLEKEGDCFPPVQPEETPPTSTPSTKSGGNENNEDDEENGG